MSAEPPWSAPIATPTLIEKKSGKFDASEFHNRYVDALKGLIEEKRKHKGEVIIQDPDDDTPKKGSNVIDLMAAIEAKTV